MKKNSINHWITLWFIVILAVSVAVTAVENYFATRNETIAQAKVSMERCANIVSYLLDQWNLDALTDGSNPSQYNTARRILRNLCQSFRLDYLYVYTIDPTTETRIYDFCVADTDEDDDQIQELFPLGSELQTALHPGEKTILSGYNDTQMDLVFNQYGNEMSWFVPYLDDGGSMCALIGMDTNFEVGQEMILTSFLKRMAPKAVLLVAAQLVMLLLVRRRIIVPINAISKNMERFAQDSSHTPEPLNIRSKDEIGEIVKSFEKMTGDISAYVNNIEALTKERLETNVQLDVARRIQYGLVPETTTLNGPGYSVSAMTRPAKTVGGDFYDCFQRDETSVCVFIGDVSGKGISAAILMAMAKTMLREKLLNGLGPAEALNQANDALCAQNPEGLFATAFVAVLNTKTGELCFANAGHTYPALLGKTPSLFMPDHGIALGIFEDSNIQESTMRLSPGEGILLYTDGVTEAVNPQRQFFGEARVIDALRDIPVSADTAREAIRRVNGAVQDFCEGNEQFDDMAILALVHQRKQTESDWKALPVALSAFQEIKQAVFSAAGETPETRRALLACDEALANIVHYSHAEHLAFSCIREGDTLRVAFQEDGIPFDPVTEQAEDKEFDSLDSGGMGLRIIRQSSSEMSYERKGNLNELTLYFPLQPL